MKIKVKDSENELNSLRTKKITTSSIPTLVEKKLPPFKEKIKYNSDKDPFRNVQEDYLTDVKDKPWVSAQAGSTHIDPILVDALDNLHQGINNPENLPENVRSALNSTGYKLSVTSTSRTPWHQATTISSSSSDGNLKASYASSNHLFGQAVDMSINEWNSGAFDEAKLSNIKTILSHFGLTIPYGMSDKVHITLIKKPASWVASRIAMSTAYAGVATSLKSNQEQAIQTGIFVNNKLEKQLTQLDSDLASKVKEKTDKANIFQNVSAQAA